MPPNDTPPNDPMEAQMSVTKASLKKSFENGALPNGEDFANLIDFFTPKAAFDAHIKAFDAQKSASDVTLGADGKGWTLSLDASKSHVWLAPDGHEPTPYGPPDHVAADVGLYGWVGMGGRVGTTTGQAAFQGTTSDLADRLPKSAVLKSDGTRQTLFEAPERPCVLEIVAATNRPIAQKPPAFARVKQTLGFAAPDNAVLHAIATTTAGVTPPSVTASGAPTGWLRALGIVVLAFALFFAVMGHLDPQAGAGATATPTRAAAGTPPDKTNQAAAPKTEDASSEEDKAKAELEKLEQEAKTVLAKLRKLLGGSFATVEKLVHELLAKINLKGLPEDWLRTVAIGLAVLAGAIYVNRARNAQMNAITVTWVRTGSKSSAGADLYRLDIQGPNLARLGGNSDLYVHVTRLWS